MIRKHTKHRVQANSNSSILCPREKGESYGTIKREFPSVLVLYITTQFWYAHRQLFGRHLCMITPYHVIVDVDDLCVWRVQAVYRI